MKQRKFNPLNNMVALVVVGIILLIIVPLPTWLLDIMFIFNIAISFIILIITLYITEPLEFSVFPSVLLVTTVFRLSLNVAATRRILFADGDAGQVIRAFGKFVIQDNVVIGFVIFLIIFLAQFMVITKGTERVAEVTARFTLDAMPGKQMAIDADLNAGLIDEATAFQRRTNIQREADLFGSMDGATKFVKGDTIISIVITIVNLIGGILLGFMNNVGDFNDILDLYGTATIGNGLMSQIPSLLVSVATGIMVTRSGDLSVNKALGKQFISQPIALIMSGGIMLLLIFIGFPPVQIIIVSGTLISLGIVILRKVKQEGPEPLLADGVPADEHEEEIISEANYYRNVDNVYGLLTVEQIEVEFGYSLLPLADEASGGSFVDRVVMFRKQFAQEMGMVVPTLRLVESGNLVPNQYAIRLKGEQVAVGDVLIDHYLALSPGDMPDGLDDGLDGIDAIEPAFGIPAKWISEDKRPKAELAGYTLVDPTSVIIAHLAEIIRQHAHELLNRQAVGNMLANLRKTNETIVEDTVPAIISMSDLQKVLQSLVREGVPIRDLETILETLSDYALTIKDTDMLTEYVRQALRRTISHRYSDTGQMKVITLDANIENMIMNSVKRIDGGSYLALEPDIIQAIMSATNEQVEMVKDIVQTPIVLTSPIVRIYFKKLVDQFYPKIVVLSFNEIDTNVQIQALGNISI